MTTKVEDVSEEMVVEEVQQEKLQELKNNLFECAIVTSSSHPIQESLHLPPPIKPEHEQAKKRRPPPAGNLMPKRLTFETSFVGVSRRTCPLTR